MFKAGSMNLTAVLGAGVDPTRILVAGYGEFHPIVPNPAKGGAAENRRVELILVPMVPDPALAAEPEQLALPDIPSK